jgi:hypothetical protein
LGAAIPGIEGGEVMSVHRSGGDGKLSRTGVARWRFRSPLILAESLNNLFTAIHSENQIHCKETLQSNKETEKQKKQGRGRDDLPSRPVPGSRLTPRGCKSPEL